MKIKYTYFISYLCTGIQSGIHLPSPIFLTIPPTDWPKVISGASMAKADNNLGLYTSDPAL